MLIMNVGRRNASAAFRLFRNDPPSFLKGKTVWKIYVPQWGTFEVGKFNSKNEALPSARKIAEEWGEGGSGKRLPRGSYIYWEPEGDLVPHPLLLKKGEPVILITGGHEVTTGKVASIEAAKKVVINNINNGKGRIEIKFHPESGWDGGLLYFA